jgi:uncharacterized protein (TIGR02266 family)
MGNKHRQGGAERRRHPRVQLGVRVDIVSGSNFYGAHGRDISLGGLFIETSAFLPLGSKITVELTLRGARHVLPAEVVWSVEHEDGHVGLGVQFERLSYRARTVIQRFMRSRAPLEFACEAADEPAPCMVDDTPRLVIQRYAPPIQEGGWPVLKARSRRLSAP